MKLSIFVLCFLSVQTFEKDSVVSGFQVQPPLTIQSVVPRTITTRKTTTTLSITNSHHPHPPTALYNVFGGLFDVGSRNKKSLSAEEPLIIYSATTTTMEDEDQVFNSLGEYIEEWSKLITNGSIALTTPVTVELVVPTPEDSATRHHRGIRLLFKDTRSGYKSKTEEKESNPTASSNDAQDSTTNNKKKSKKQKQGGVEILVETKNNGVQVTAKRCEVEEDTIIKEMSEETIIHELKEALQVWKREHSK